MSKIKCSECGTKYSGKCCPQCSAPATEPPEKKKKKWVIPVVIILVIALLASCIGGGEEEPEQPVQVDPDSSVTDTQPAEQDSLAEQLQESTEAVETPAADAAIQETQIYNAGGITIVATQLESDLFGQGIAVTIANESEANVNISVRDLSVNGYMMPYSGLYCDVAAGKKANETITLSSTELSRAGIGTIAQVEFYVDVTDSDTYDSIDISPLVSLNTSAYGSFQQEVDDSGDVIYDNNDIRVVCKGLKSDIFWDGMIAFYIENNSASPIIVSAENVSVNGFMEDVSLWSNLRANTRLVDGMYLLDLTDLELESLEDVKEIELSLRFLNGDNWEQIDTTDVITLNFA